MKKSLFIITILAVFLSFSACGGKEAAAAPSAEPAPVLAAAPADSAAAQAVPKNDEISASVNGYTIEVLSAVKDKDYHGNDIIMVKYKFTNSNSAAAAFWQVTDQKVTQNGRSLSPEGIVSADPAVTNAYSQISGGQVVVCGYPYPLYSETDPLEITVSIYNYNSAKTLASASGTVYLTVK